MHLIISYFSHKFQSKLQEIGESRMECDYKLVENEGLFQEYLEMGKEFKRIRYMYYIVLERLKLRTVHLKGKRKKSKFT